MTQTDTIAAPAEDTAGKPRIHLLDVFRGIAILTVIAYHFSWDLENFNITYLGLLEAPFWLAARTLIAGSFLFIAGFALVLATRNGVNRTRFAWRLGKILVAAAFVSAVTYWQFPQAGVFFGILHCIVLASVIGLAFIRLPWWVPAVVGVAIAVVDYYPQSWATGDWLLWLGLGGVDVYAVDYVPLVPWLAGFLWGIAAARLILALPLWEQLAAVEVSGWLGRGIRFLGRHTLLIYLIHQPILFGLFNLWFMLTGPPKL